MKIRETFIIGYCRSFGGEVTPETIQFEIKTESGTVAGRAKRAGDGLFEVEPSELGGCLRALANQVDPAGKPPAPPPTADEIATAAFGPNDSELSKRVSRGLAWLRS